MRDIHEKAVLLSDAPEHIDQVYGAGRLDKIKAQVELYPHVISRENLAEHRRELCETQVAFSTWGCRKWRETSWPLYLL